MLHSFLFDPNVVNTMLHYLVLGKIFTGVVGLAGLLEDLAAVCIYIITTMALLNVTVFVTFLTFQSY